MNEIKKIEPTDAMVECVELGHKLMRMDDRAILRAALNHPDAAELLASEWKANAEAAAERAERAEDRLSDSVHVDEAAARVEAAREQGWDEAAEFAENAYCFDATDFRAANPYRPAPELPTEDGAVIIPAEGHEYIEARVGIRTYIAREAVVCQSEFGSANVLEGAWRRADDGSRAGCQMGRDFITPGTWKVEEK